MSLPQKKFREAVFYAVFSQDFSQSSDEEAVPMMMELLAMSKKNVRESIQRAALVLEKKAVIDECIQKYVPDYDLDRISYIERNILRLATYELLFDNEIPEVVAISEGIRLCRKFSTPEGANFINGVLDAIYKKETALTAQSTSDGY